MRKVYDETGTLITDDDSFESFTSFDDYVDYWRQLFPKVTEQKLNDFFEKYTNSIEEEDDLKQIYVRFEGDMDLVYEYHFGYDDEYRIENILNRLIENGDIPAFDLFCNEPKSKKMKRMKRIEKEHQQSKKEETKRKKQKTTSDNDQSSLIMAIQQRSKSNFGNMISNLEEKYSKKKKPAKKR